MLSGNATVAVQYVKGWVWYQFLLTGTAGDDFAKLIFGGPNFDAPAPRSSWREPSDLTARQLIELAGYTWLVNDAGAPSSSAAPNVVWAMTLSPLNVGSPTVAGKALEIAHYSIALAAMIGLRVFIRFEAELTPSEDASKAKKISANFAKFCFVCISWPICVSEASPTC